MSRKWFSILALVAAATLLLNLSSCGFNSHLVSIQIAPTTFTFGAATPPQMPASLFVNFSATGTYEHPPRTVDITNLVTWGTDASQVLSFSSTIAGLASPGNNCGVAGVTANFYDSPNLVSSNSATVTVDGPLSSGCTPAGPPPILTVDLAGTGTGTVTGGISCSTPGSCSDQFTAGSTVMLTASPTNNSIFGGWSGCSQTSGTGGVVCTVLTLENNLTVTATFSPTP